MLWVVLPILVVVVVVCILLAMVVCEQVPVIVRRQFSCEDLHLSASERDAAA